MNPTKLSHLEKETMLSKWQKEQIEKKHNNSQMFLSPQHPTDPWENERKLKSVTEQIIPPLQNTQWNTRFRSNRDMNQNMVNKKILASKSMFK